MDANAKKTAPRMIPYGLYVLTGESDGRVAAATVNWVTQASFEPPLIAVGVKADSSAHEVIKQVGAFALNVLGKGQRVARMTRRLHCKISGRRRSTGVDPRSARRTGRI